MDICFSEKSASERLEACLHESACDKPLNITLYIYTSSVLCHKDTYLRLWKGAVPAEELSQFDQVTPAMKDKVDSLVHDSHNGTEHLTKTWN